MLKTTPFHAKHLAAGGRMVAFAGYELPVQFRGIVAEHRRVRSTAGVFDVSHMGRIELRGKDATRWLNRMTTNDVTRLAENQAQYSVLCRDDGGIVDDLVVYRLADHYLLVVNGANNEKDTAWLQDHLAGDVKVVNVTERTAQIAVQGPKSETALQKIASTDLATIGFYRSAAARVGDVEVLVSRTGYTGEDGFEIYLPAGDADRIWDAVFAAGAEYEAEPIGLGARDTLRMEMKMALYGNDIDETTNPIEAGLSWVVALDKPGGFIGADVLRTEQAKKPARRLVCLEMREHGIPRPHYSVFSGSEDVGRVTSGTLSPSLNVGIAIGYVRRELAKPGTELAIDIRGRHLRAEVVKPPFYKHGSRK